MVGSKEFYELLEQFEKQYRHLRLDREDTTLWPRSHIYQNGEVNQLFLAFRRGYFLGKSVMLSELPSRN